MRAPSFLTSLALALVLPLSGCGGDHDDDHEAGDATGRRVEAAGDTPQIEVVDRGAQPRRLLRLTAQEGQIESTSMTMRQSQTIADGPPTTVPPLTLTFTTEVLEVGPDRIGTEIVYGRPTVEHRGADPAMVSQMEDALEPIDGMTGRSVVSSRGENLETSFELPDDLPAMMESVMQQVTDQATALMVPFPTGRVGAGASWTATSGVEFNGIEILQVATYSLDALDGANYRISVDLEQTYEPGPAHGFDLKSGTGEAHGRIRGSTEFLTPQTSTATMSNEILGETDGETVEIGTRIEMGLRSGPS